MNPIKITLLSDYACPYCYVGKGIIKKLSKEYDIEVNWVPFELYPDRPKEGVVMQEELPGVDLDEMVWELNQASEGLGIKFSPFDRMSNTRLALEASEFARDNGKLDEFQELLYKALFTDNKDIGQLDLILSYAKDVGLNPDELKRALDEGVYAPHVQAGRELGEKHKIELIPTFIINDDQGTIVGSHTYGSFVAALEKIQKGITEPAEETSETTTKGCGPEGCRL